MLYMLCNIHFLLLPVDFNKWITPFGVQGKNKGVVAFFAILPILNAWKLFEKINKM